MSSSSWMFPTPSEAALKTQFIGRSLKDVDAPAAVLDRAVVVRNCERMRTAASAAGVRFRGHVKTHKTVELTQLQVGSSDDVRLIVSTIAELEHLTPWLLDCRKQGKSVDVIYGVPASIPSLVRLIEIALLLDHETATTPQGRGSHRAKHPSEPLVLSVKIIVDAVAQFHAIQSYLLSNHRSSPFQLAVYVKIDTGYGRAGISAQSQEYSSLLHLLVASETNPKHHTFLVLEGLYSHLGSSYGATGHDKALRGLKQEITGLVAASAVVKDAYSHNPGKRLVLSVGASPTALALDSARPDGSWDQTASDIIRSALEDITGAGDAQTHVIEVHAGVYTTLDLQQLATKSYGTMGQRDIGIAVLAEVVSVYRERDRPEALISAGNLALGREPCKEYSGWGVLTGWRGSGVSGTANSAAASPVYDFEAKTGWIVGRISQEHGILVWEGDESQRSDLEVGEKVLIWPNHSCIAGAMFGWYLVVDSSKEGMESDIVQDVWVRCRGW